MVDKLDYKIVGLAIVFLLCWMGFYPQACSGVVVWSDDFDDGNHDGWTICENTVIVPESNWTASNNYLELNQEEWGAISHPSNVAYGTWSFDFKANETQVESGTFSSIAFISNNITNLADFNDWTCYWIYFEAISTSEGLSFTIKLRKNVLTIIDSSETNVPIAGWHHMKVTRTETGLFSVYHNGSPIMQGEDTDIDTTELFVFGIVESGGMIDNIVVDNEIAPPPPAPIDWVLIATIGASAVVIVAVLVIILRRR